MNEQRDASEIAAYRFRRRLGRLLFLRQAVFAAAVWCIAWGVGGLILKALLGLDGRALLWGAAGLAPALLAAGVLSGRQRPSLVQVRALLDGLYACGGLLMSSGEADVDPWRDRVPAVSSPALRWRPWRRLGLLAASAAVVAGALLAPVRAGGGVPDTGLDVGGEVARLKDQITALEEEDILREGEAASLREKLEQVAAESRGEDPVRTLEALDHVAAKLSEAAAEALEESVAASREAEEARKLASDLAGGADRLDPAVRAEAMKELARQLRQAREGSRALAETVPESACGACREGRISSEELERIAGALGESRREMLERLRRMRREGLIDPETLERACRQCSGESMDPGRSLAEFLKANPPSETGLTEGELIRMWRRSCGDGPGAEGSEALSDALREGFGHGGIARGRGDAPMTWKDPSNAEGVTFRAEVLPPDQLRDLKASVLLGTGRGAPRITETGDARGGALTGAAAGGGAAHRRVILPKHRKAVEDYFKRSGPDAAGEGGGS